MVGSASLAGSPTVSDPPYYRRIVDDIRARIARGEWPSGTKLPSTAELVLFYQGHFSSSTLSRITVRRAVDILIENGELRGQQGLGVFVADSSD